MILFPEECSFEVRKHLEGKTGADFLQGWKDLCDTIERNNAHIFFELFQKYGRHSVACEDSDSGRLYKGGELIECSCGFAQAVAALPQERI